MNQILCSWKAYILIAFLIAPACSFSQISKADENRKRVFADPKVSSSIISEKRQTPSFISLKSNVQGYSRAQVKPVLNNFVGARAGIDDAVLDKETKKEDREVLEFQQYYKGIKVDRAKFKAYLDKGKLEF